MSAVPHCPNCGYNLTGLDLPHRCPECGHLADAVAEREAAVRWYSSWNAFLLRKTPPMALAYIGDARCRRHAWRRWLLLVLVPWLAVTPLFLLINSVQEIETHETWWERPENPSQKLHYQKTADTNRLLTLNLDLHLQFFGSKGDFKDVPGAARREKTTRSFVLSWPEPDALTWLLFLIPPAIGVVGIWLLAGVLLVCRLATRRRRPTLGPGAAWPLAALLGPWLAAALAMHLASAVCVVMKDIAQPYTSLWGDAAGLLIFAALGTYLLGGVFVLCQTVRVSRRHRSGLLTWVPFAACGIIWLAAIVGLWFAALGLAKILS